MPQWALIVATSVAAYLIGGIPFGLLVGKLFFKTDVRQHGSGNIGATNVLRTLGPVAGGITFALDVLKGTAAVLVASVVVPGIAGEPGGGTVHQLAGILAMGGAILGHSYSPYLGFKGGKGVATAAGAIFALFVWPVWVIEIVIFVLVVAITRWVSLGSVVIAFAFPVLIYIWYPNDWLMVVFGTVMSALVIWRHRTNIGRILRGEENKISFGRGSGSGGSAPKGE